jgi:hypothetical protein
VDTSFLEDRNAPLLWCAGRDPKNADILVVKVKVNRAYGIGLIVNATPAWTYRDYWSDASLDDLIYAGIRTAVMPAWLPPWGRRAVFVPPGAELDFGFTEAQLRAMPKAITTLLEASPDSRWILAGWLYGELDKIAPEESFLGYVLTLAAIVNCGTELSSATGVAESIGALARCLTDDPEKTRKVFIDLAARAAPTASSKALATVGVAVQKALMELQAFLIGAQIGELTSDLRMVPAARRFSVFVEPPPPTFYGEWTVHGGGVTFRSDGTGTAFNHVGFTPGGEWLNEVQTLRTRLSTDGRVLNVSVVEDHFETIDRQGVPHRYQPSPQEAQPTSHPGDMSEVRFAGRDLLVTAPTGSGPGNPYLCGPHVSPANSSKCGA